MNPLRKIIQKTGFDLHRYRVKTDYWKYLKTQKINTILDIGANIGQFVQEIRQILPETQIYSFEPIKECFKALENNFNRDSNFKAYNYALGDKEEEIEMNKSAYTPSSSLLFMSQTHKDLFPHTKKHTKEKIKVRTLDSVVEEISLSKEILIKVDVQGFEDKVIVGGKETFKKTKIVLIENSFVELYRGQPLFDDIYKKLKYLGFKYQGSLQQKIDKHTGKIISEDSIFLKQ